MAAQIAVAVLAFCGTLIGSIMSSQKTVWRIDQLERKVEKHNQVMERVALLEQDERTQWRTIDELKEELERIKDEQ